MVDLYREISVTIWRIPPSFSREGSTSLNMVPSC